MSFREKLKQKNNLLNTLTETTAEEIKNPTVIKILDWNIEQISGLWQQFYTEKISSEAQKTAYKSAKLSLGEAAETIYIEISHTFHKDEIAKNTALINELKTQFARPTLSFIFNLIELPETIEQRRRSALSPEDRKRENEEPYLEQNPLLQKLKDILGLEIKK